MLVAIIDYGSGNLRSAEKAFQRASLEAGLNATIKVTADSDLVTKADRVVLPGVGAYADCRRGLDAVQGMVEALTETVIHKARPFLGICVGMQLMSTRGLEKETTLGLDWISGDVVPMQPADKTLRIPQIGWNTLDAQSDHALLKHIPLGQNGWHAYFVHSYHMAVTKPDQLVATTDYGMAVTAMVGRDNMVGTQFHPEKSQKLGLKLLSNFLGWRV
jgi:imidazole glycerol-phosphate synthase subunit HisH